MSGLLSATGFFATGDGASPLIGALGIGDLLDWRGRMLDGSFRGVPFYVQSHDLTGGRRGILHEFPNRERPATEDLGKAAERYTITAYVVGPDYDFARSALKQAVFDTQGPGTLVHPYLGTLQVQMLPGCTVREQIAPSQIAVFRLVCVDAGTAPLTSASIDTVAQVIADAKAALVAIQAGYAIAVATAKNPAFLAGFITAGLSSLAGSILGLPPAISGALALDTAALQADPGTVAANTAATVAQTFTDAAIAIVANPPAPPDLTGGLAALTSWQAAAFPVNPTLTPVRAQQQINAQALVNLVQGSAIAAIAQVYAQTDFQSYQDATTARTQFVGWVSAIADAAAAQGDTASYNAWWQLGSSTAADLSQRAQNLPQRAAYTAARPRTALALAQLLYQDASQADGLVALNDAVHPAFMPPAGLWLQPTA